MFIVPNDLAFCMRDSEDYKLIKHEGWLYLFPIDADFEFLAENLGSSKWDELAAITIDDRGNVRKNRHGQLTHGSTS